MNTSLCFMLQARVGSTRLPQKMILPFFEDKNILELIILKLQQNFPEIPIVLATSKQSENDVLESVAKQMGCKVFKGSENDVLQRFIDAAEAFQFDTVIRVCADNPFLDIAELHQLISYVQTNQTFDYVSFTINGNPSIKTHFGFWTEYVTLQALKKVNLLTDDPFYHEHVTNYIYGHDDSFLIKFLEANPVLEGKNNIRMTLDTLVDFNILSEIYQKLQGVYGKNFGINEIVSFLDENEEYKKVMTNQITENSK